MNAPLAALVVALSLVDAALTLRGARGGGGELNPLLRATLAASPWVFVGLKLALTAGCVDLARQRPRLLALAALAYLVVDVAWAVRLLRQHG